MISLKQLLNEVMGTDNEPDLEESKAGEEAKRLGLTYMRFGRYGKDGKVTHTSVDGKLQPVKGKDAKAPAKASAPSKAAPSAKGRVSTPAAKAPAMSQTDQIAAQRRASTAEKLPITPRVSKKMGSILDKHIKSLEKEREKEIKVFPKEKEWYDGRVAQFKKISKLVKQGNVEEAFNEWNKLETQDTDDTIYTALQPVITWLETHMGDYLLGTTGSARNDRELRANAERWGFQRSPHVERSRKRMGIKVKEPRPKWN